MMSAQPLKNTTDIAKNFYPQRFMLWQSRGLSARASSALALAQCDTVEQVTALGRDWFLGKPNVGPKTLRELSSLAGWPAGCKTAADAIAATLSMAIDDAEEARETAIDVLLSLRRAGFVVVAAASRRGVVA